MNRFKRPLFILIIILSSSLYISIAIATETPEELIKDIFDRAGKENLLNNQSSKEIVDSHVNFKEMCKDILADEIHKRTPEEIAWFEVTIKDILTYSVYPSAPEFLNKVTFSFKPTKFLEDKAMITSTVSKKGESTQVDYVLKKNGNDWKVIDIAIDEESWVKTINEQVKKTILKKGWRGLKDMLIKRLNELKNPKKAS